MNSTIYFNPYCSYNNITITWRMVHRVVFGRSWLQPDINGKVIVEDELLNFLADKIKTLSQEEIVLLAWMKFDSEWIESSKKVLFDLCPTSQRIVAHKGQQTDANNIKSCLECWMSVGRTFPDSFHIRWTPSGVISQHGRIESAWENGAHAFWTDGKEFVDLNLYTPHESCENEYLHRLAFINSFN